MYKTYVFDRSPVSTDTSRIRALLGLSREDAPSEICGDVELYLGLVGDTEDTSGQHREPDLHGDAYVAGGVHFDGYGDYVSTQASRSCL